jgi:hypothetical protein
VETRKNKNGKELDFFAEKEDFGWTPEEHGKLTSSGV